MFGDVLDRPVRLVRTLMAALTALLVAASHAAPVPYTLGPDPSGIGRVLTALDAVGTPAPLFTLGDGSTTFNGLSYRTGDGRFYAVSNDAFGSSSLVSFAGSGPGTLTTIAPLGEGVVGMTHRSSVDGFYAVSTSSTGESTLLLVTPTGSAGVVGAPGSLGIGFIGGLAFGSSTDLLYGIAADLFGVPRVLNAIDLDAGTATALFELGDGSLAFNGGLAYDDVAGEFRVIGSDFTGASSLYSFDLSGATSLAALGGIGPGYLNASLVMAPALDPRPAPEPGTLSLLLAAVLGVRFLSATPRHRRTSMRPAHALRITFLAALATLTGAAQAQFSSPTRNVENPDRFPYQERATGSISPGIVNAFMLFPTPTGKRFVIEYVSVSCTTPSASDSFPQALLSVTRITSPSSTFSFSVPAVNMTFRGPSFFGGYIWAGTANVKLYSDYSPFDPSGGNAINLNVFHTDAGVTASCQGVVSGHTFTP